MPRSRIFLSSTCYDLSVVRTELTRQLEGLGHEVINSEQGTFGVTPGLHSHSACLDQVKEADYLILIIGKRHGGIFIGSDKSITNEEYRAAVKLSVPVIAFVDRAVQETASIYKKNPSADLKSIVDDPRVYHFVDYITAGATDNWLHTYSSIEDIVATVKMQLSHCLREYSRSLRAPKIQKSKASKDEWTVAGLPDNLPDLSGGEQDFETFLKDGIRHLHSVIKSICSSQIKVDSKREQLKTLWIFGKLGECNDGVISVQESNFKMFAWGHYRGQRVFEQLEHFGVSGSYDFEEVPPEIHLVALERVGGDAVMEALVFYVKKLLSSNTEEQALERFMKADMRDLLASD